MQEPSKEKKIIVDEDWKSQVEAERRAAAEAAQSGQTDRQPGGQQPGGHEAPGTMPPASLDTLVSTLATEAMVSMGQLPHPATGHAAVNLDQARYFVDTLAVIQQKTQGNLTPEESQGLEAVLHQLRMLYVGVKNAAAQPQQANVQEKQGP